jgi:beta-lactam-binding protein with PASTA domain
MTQDHALTEIEQSGLSVGITYHVFSNAAPKGHIASQSPAAGTQVQRGTDVQLWVSKGPDESPIEVPGVTGLTLTQAGQTLSHAGLHSRSVTEEYSVTVPQGIVMRQNPAAGTQVPAYTDIQLTISIGRPPSTVPDVVGMQQQDGATAIVAADLIVGAVTQVFSDTVPDHEIISQDPVGGAQVPFGSAVRLEVSEGPAVVTVPNVIDLPRANAAGAIVNARLAVGTVDEAFSDSIAAGNIAVQDPVGGTLVPSGSPVDLIVSLGLGVEVPDVVGMHQVHATSTLLAANLTVGTVTQVMSNSVPKGNIVDQDPAGGIVAPAGSSVNLTVSMGRPSGDGIPDMVGLWQVDAAHEIENRNLYLKPTDEFSPTIPAGIVMSQNPAPGEPFSPGTRVYVVISKGPDAGGDYPTRRYDLFPNYQKISSESMVRTLDGGFALAGDVGFATDPADAAAHLIRTDVEGNVLWKSSYSDSANPNWQNSIGGMVQTVDGAFIVLGAIHGPVDYYEYVWKIDELGNDLWIKRMYDTQTNELSLVAVDATSDGGCMLAGGKVIEIDTDLGRVTSAWNLLRMDASGNVLWDEVYGADDANLGYERCRSIQVTSDDRFILGGDSPTNVFSIRKIDESGIELWQKFYGETLLRLLGDAESCDFIRETSDGGFIGLGAGCFNRWSTDIYIVRVDSDGNTLWKGIYGGYDADRAFAITETSDGGFVLVGRTYSFPHDTDIDPYPDSGGDAYIMKLDAYGNQLWSRVIGSGRWGAMEWAWSVEELEDGRLVVLIGTYNALAPGEDDSIVEQFVELRWMSPNGSS